MCKSLNFPLDDVVAPEGVHEDGRCHLVGFHVDSTEMETPLDLSERLGMSQTMVSRIAWRIGTCMLEAHERTVRGG